MWPYIAGFGFSVALGWVLIWHATGALWESIGRPRDRSDKELHADPELPAQVGIVERSLYTAAVIAKQEQFIAVWLGLKAISSWSLWNRFKDGPNASNGDPKGNSTVTGTGEGNTNEGTAKKEVSGRSVFNIYLISNGLSVAYGVVGGWIIEFLRDQQWETMKYAGLVFGPPILTVLIWWGARYICSKRQKEAPRQERPRAVQIVPPSEPVVTHLERPLSFLRMETFKRIVGSLWFLALCLVGLFLVYWFFFREHVAFTRASAGITLFVGTGILTLISIWCRWLPKEFLPAFTALLAAGATIAIAFLAYEQGRISSEQVQISSKQTQISHEMLAEMKLAREQQEQPYVQVWLEPDLNDQWYMVTVKNIGGGVAKTVGLTYEHESRSHGHSFPVLGPDQEVTTRTSIPFGAVSEHAIEFRVSYVDSFGNSFNEPIVVNSNSRNVPESRYSMWRESLKRRQEDEKEQLRAVQELSNAIRSLDGKSDGLSISK